MNCAAVSGGHEMDGKNCVVMNSTNSFPRFCSRPLSRLAISPMTYGM